MPGATENTVDVVATFAALEPLVGAALAITLAYLALPNLRYRDQVNGLARDALRRLEELRPSEEKCKTHYSRLVKFCDGLADKDQRERLAKHAAKIPDTEDSSPYGWIFPLTKGHKASRDAKITATQAVFCFILLILGVLENSNAFGLGAAVALIPRWLVPASLIVLVIGTLIPIMFVVIGRKWIAWASSQIDYLEKHCREEMLAEGITATIPSSPPIDMEAIAKLTEQVARSIMSAKEADDPPKAANQQ